MLKRTGRKLGSLVLLAVVAAAGGSGAYAQNSACPAPSKGLFGLGFEVLDSDLIGTCATRSFKTVQDLFDSFETSSLGDLNSAYTGSEIATLNVFFNGLPMVVDYPNQGITGSGAELLFSIPALGVSKVFQGADRDESEQLLEDYLKTSSIIGKIMKYQAAHSPHSPIAGPGGLIPTAVASDFADAFDTLPASQSGEPRNSFGVGLNFSSLTVKGLQTRVTTIPLSYTIRNNIDPRRQLAFGMPITLSDTEGAKSYHLNPGVSYRVPMTDAWSLSGAVRLGLVGSEDIGALAGVVSGSVASTYAIRGSGFDVAIGNMLGYYATTKVSSGDYSGNPDINNVVLRNGVMISQPVMLGGSNLAAEYSLIDTRYMGTEIYVDNTQEVGVTLGTNRSAFSSRSFVRAGASYLRGRDTHGLSVNIGYWF
jgi:hypothetical protein